jgi:hypothetical protein
MRIGHGLSPCHQDKPPRLFIKDAVLTTQRSAYGDNLQPGFALGHAERPHGCSTTGWMRQSIRRAARRLCRSESGFGVHAPLSKRWHAGWRRLRAGPNIAGWCPHPTGDRVPLSAARTRAAETAGGFVRHGLGLALTIRERQTPQASNAMPSPHPQGGPPQARFHPHPGCRPALAGTRGKDFSGGWLGRSARRDVPQGHPFRLILLPAEPAGAPPPPSSRRTLRQIPGGLPPAWTGTLTIHPVTGVRQ